MTSLKTVFGIDLRSLALFRMSLAVMILVDLISRSRDLSAFYTDNGVLSRSASMSYSGSYHWSLYWINGSECFVILLFVLAALVAFLLLMGYKSRLMAFISWALLLSLQTRNGFINTGGDSLLLVMSFWAILLPIGARYSVDAAVNLCFKYDCNTHINTDHNYFSVISIAALFQVMYLYFFTAVLKTGDSWRETMDAAYYAVHLEQFATLFGIWLRDFPNLLTFGTYFVWYLEMMAIVLVFSPIFHVPLRLIALVLLIIMHGVFFLSLHIAIFPFVDLMSLTLLVPKVCWEWLTKINASSERKALTIYYDQQCGFCKKSTLVLRCFLLPDSVRIFPAQEYPNIYAIMEQENSWVIKTHQGDIYTHWNAVQYLFRISILFRPLGIIMGWKPLLNLGNALYRWIAQNRAKMGNFTARFLPYTEPKVRSSWWENLVGLGAFYIVSYYNIAAVPQWNISLPKHVKSIGRVLRLDQRWDMFAPYPLKYSLLPVITGKTRNGAVVDLYSMQWGEPQREFPTLLSWYYKNYRWRKYFGRVHSHKNDIIRLGYGSYLCRQWNDQSRAYKQQLATLTIEFERLKTQANYQASIPSNRKVWTHWCFKEYANK